MITVKVLEDTPIKIGIKDDVFSVEIIGEITKIISSDVERYSGDYEVTPQFESQTLKTQNLLMENDVTVREISVIRIANTSGGSTVIIGG